MPLRQLTAYVAGVAHVRAIESVRLFEAVAVATSGHLKRSSVEEVQASWRKDLRRAVKRPRTPAELQGAAAAAGIGFRRVVRKVTPA